MYKSGFVTVVGRPNVGKSTLLNKVIGEKISIISNKPQTTRNQIQLVYTEDDAQIVFLDTPGMQNPKNVLGEYMLKVSRNTLEEVDVITYMVDESLEIGAMDRKIIEELRTVSTPIILVINKIDKMSAGDLAGLVEKFEKMDMFKAVIPISALNDENVEEYIDSIKELLLEGPQYFPEDMITDQPERFIVSEIIREKALIFLDEELPHGIYVSVEKMRRRPKKAIVDVEANIYCEKDSHKGMIIGKGGKMLKKIGVAAREDIENLLDTKVNLQLWVKVEKNWREKEGKVKYFGYK